MVLTVRFFKNKQFRGIMMLTEKAIREIADDYARQNQSRYCSFQLVYIRKSLFLDGYYDVKYRVVDQFGREIDASLMMEIDIQSGNMISLEELIKILILQEKQ